MRISYADSKTMHAVHTESFSEMFNLVSILLLAATLLLPPIILSRYENRLGWRKRYFLSVLPMAYSGLGWGFGVLAYDFLGCQGGMKNVHACFFDVYDYTLLVDYGIFLMIPFLFIATPVSLWLLLSTCAKHIGTWHRQNFPLQERQKVDE